MKYRSLLVLLSMLACVNPPAKGSKDVDELSTLYVTEPSGLLLRDAPSLAGNPLEQMPMNSQVRLLEPPARDQPVSARRSTWVRVQFKGQVGYALIASLGEHPAEHSADNRVFNQSRSAYYIVTISEPGPNICGYGIDPRADRQRSPVVIRKTLRSTGAHQHSGSYCTLTMLAGIGSGVIRVQFVDASSF